MVLFGILIVLLLIVDNSQLRIDERIAWIDLLGLK